MALATPLAGSSAETESAPAATPVTSPAPSTLATPGADEARTTLASHRRPSCAALAAGVRARDPEEIARSGAGAGNRERTVCVGSSRIRAIRLVGILSDPVDPGRPCRAPRCAALHDRTASQERGPSDRPRGASKMLRLSAARGGAAGGGSCSCSLSRRSHRTRFPAMRVPGGSAAHDAQHRRLLVVS